MIRTLMALAGMLLSLPAFPAPPANAGAPAGETSTWQEPLTGMTFVAIPKGCYRMGADAPQPPQGDYFWERAGYQKSVSEDEKPRHEVCLDPFWIGKYEVRAAEWVRVMGGPAPQTEGLPAAGISWQQAQEFASRLTEMSEGKARFRLPTEAEWEYACRGGEKDINPLENAAVGKAWFQFSMTPQPVGQLQPNAYGLHDMLGNVWEWVADTYVADGYTRHSLYNPVVRNDAKAGAKGVPAPQKVLRGGSARTEVVQVRCAMRGHSAPDAQLDTFGFRLVRER